MINIFDDGKHTFQYRITRNRGQKNIYLRIKSGIAVVSADKRISQNFIENFLQDKASWVVKHITNTAKQPKLTCPDATVHIFGKAYAVLIDIDKSKRSNTLEIINNKAYFLTKETLDDDGLKKLLNDYYKKLSLKYIAPIVDECSSMMNLYPQKITFRSMKSRWGSCSSLNNISLNTALAMLPKELIEYVVIHELSHIKHKNHSKDFWSLVQRYLPQHKQHRKDLRKYEIFL